MYTAHFPCLSHFFYVLFSAASSHVNADIRLLSARVFLIIKKGGTKETVGEWIEIKVVCFAVLRVNFLYVSFFRAYLIR